MALKGLLLKLALEPRVVQRKPGRLRVHVAGLMRIPGNMAEPVDELLTRLVGALDGIESVKVSLESGHILFRYDEGMLGERDILKHFKRVAAAIRTHWDELRALSFEEISDWAEELANELER